MKITAATVRDFKRIREITVSPEADRYLLLIGGNNSQGKSSLLDALTSAFGGRASLPGEPVRRGAERAEVVVELDGGTYTIRLVIPRGGEPRLEVTGPDGKIAKPQTWLDKLVGARFLDPLAFMAGNKPEDDRRRRAALLQLIGVDLDAFASERKALFDERTAVGRLRAQAEAELARLPPATEKPPAARSQAAIRADLDQIEAERRGIAGAQAARREAQVAHEALRAQGDRLRDEIERLQEQLAALEPKIEAARVKVADATTATIVSAPAAIERLDERRTALLAEAARAETLARWEAASEVAARQRQRAEDAVREHGAGYQRLTDQLAAVDQRQAAALAGAQMPVPDLSVTDHGIAIDGIPWSQASQSERMRVSLAVAMRLSPGVQDIWIRDGSLLDDDALADLHAQAMFADCQLWVERVGEKDEGAIVIRDGRVLGSGGEG